MGFRNQEEGNEEDEEGDDKDKTMSMNFTAKEITSDHDGLIRPPALIPKLKMKEEKK